MTNKSDIAVSVQGLSKAYTIAHNAAKHTTAGEALMHKLKNPFERAEKETFWALKDVSFDIHKGDVVGIIGRNGAGKSTLLKVLSRITEPTSGRAILNGRVGSLLEVGTGFHGELTGRENIYMNGAILGMSKREINKHFDAIVDFAEVEQFLDTPVKRYSSGMYVRLAFAVAAHLNSEILIVDEVLAVGDAEFQKKCLGKMQNVSQQDGRTVLFVSHNEAVVKRLCRSAILLRSGQVDTIGLPEEAFKSYRKQRTETSFSLANRTMSSTFVQLTDAFITVDGIRTYEMSSGCKPLLSLTVDVYSQVKFAPEIVIRDANSTPVMFASIWYSHGTTYKLKPGTYSFTYLIDIPYLATGKYSIDLLIVDPTVQFFDFVEEALNFFINSSGSVATGFQYRQALGRGCIFLDTQELSSEMTIT